MATLLIAIMLILTGCNIITSRDVRCTAPLPLEDCSIDDTAQTIVTYNKTASQCIHFFLKGRDCIFGIHNIFPSLQDCTDACIASISLPPMPLPTTPPPTKPPPTMPPGDICQLNMDMGAYDPHTNGFRFYYNSTQYNCQEFFYLGASGNQNNFETKSDCMTECGEDVIPSFALSSTYQYDTPTTTSSTSYPSPKLTSSAPCSSVISTSSVEDTSRPSSTTTEIVSSPSAIPLIHKIVYIVLAIVGGVCIAIILFVVCFIFIIIYNRRHLPHEINDKNVYNIKPECSNLSPSLSCSSSMQRHSPTTVLGISKQNNTIVLNV